MRKFYTLPAREVRGYFHSPIGYIVVVFFLLVTGVNYYFQISFMNQRPASYSVQEAFFNNVFFWLPFILIFPLITMRLFAEEFKLGTIEPLMTAPVRDGHVVLSKFFGALVFYLVLWVPTVLYFAIFLKVTHQPAAHSAGAYFGSYLMLLLLGMFYLSIGCLTSVLTNNQIIAAIISFCAITLLFFLGLVQFILLDVSSATRDLLGYFSAMVNSIAFKHYKRLDFSRDQKYALSDKTKRFLKTLKGKMRVTIFFSPNMPIAADVQNLLTEYQYAGNGKIDIEHIDPERNLSRAKELFDKYKVVTDESLLVLDYEGRNKTVKASEMADIDQSGMAFGEGPRVAAFKGEQAITSAMIDLVEGTKKTLAYVLGHKEPPLLENSAISVLKTFIENENIRFQELNLFDVDAVPAEMNAIVIIGQQYDYSDREMKLLRYFWDKQGRILLLLDPAARTRRLHAFLNELGVKVNDDRLMAMVRTGIQELALTRDVQAHFLSDSPITKRLANANALFFGGTSSLTLEPDRARAANLRIEPLIQAEKGYFAEPDYNADDQAKLQADAKRNS